MIDLLVGCGPQPIATFKKWMAEVGVDCGPARLPLEPPTTAEFSQTLTQLHALGRPHLDASGRPQPAALGLRNGLHQKPIAGHV